MQTAVKTQSADKYAYMIQNDQVDLIMIDDECMCAQANSAYYP